MLDDFTPNPRAESVAILGLLKWLKEDYGDNMQDLVIIDLMELARAQPDMPLLDVIQHIALDWAK